MGSTTTKSGRDTAFMFIATFLGGAVARKIDADAEAQAAFGVVIFAVLSFGWRALRRFAPWVDETPA